MGAFITVSGGNKVEVDMPYINGIQYNAFINGQKIWDDAPPPPVIIFEENSSSFFELDPNNNSWSCFLQRDTYIAKTITLWCSYLGTEPLQYGAPFNIISSVNGVTVPFTYHSTVQSEGIVGNQTVSGNYFSFSINRNDSTNGLIREATIKLVQNNTLEEYFIKIYQYSKESTFAVSPTNCTVQRSSSSQGQQISMITESTLNGRNIVNKASIASIQYSQLNGGIVYLSQNTGSSRQIISNYWSVDGSVKGSIKATVYQGLTGESREITISPSSG